jgi:hypothetical protein
MDSRAGVRRKGQVLRANPRLSQRAALTAAQRAQDRWVPAGLKGALPLIE